MQKTAGSVRRIVEILVGSYLEFSSDLLYPAQTRDIKSVTVKMLR